MDLRKLPEKVVRAYRAGGISEIRSRARQRIYDLIRSTYLKHREFIGQEEVFSYNGVNTRVFVNPLDQYVPFHDTWWQRDIAHYEDELMEAIQNFVHEGDSVTIVGGGVGITMIEAARQVGRKGTVTAYEGALDAVLRMYKTLQENEVSCTASIQHAIVGPEKHLRANAKTARSISPTELKYCDVLELDCEGAELEIIENLPFNPRTIIVETHGVYGASTAEVKGALQRRGYEIVSEEPHVPEDDVFVLVAAHSRSE